MQHVPAKRAFLKGRFQEKPMMRPLGALGVGEFEELCTQCGDCARVCPEAIIFRDRDGFPVVDLTKGECTFCDACTDACEPGALVPDTDWNWRANATSACLSVQGVSCRTCEDNCPQQAISFRLQTGGKATANINHDLCVGCGSCASQCPAGAIEFTQIKPHDGGTPC